MNRRGQIMDGRRVVVVTNYWAKPIPIRTSDWQATLDGWEPGEPIGHGESEADAVYDLFMQIEDREEEEAQEEARYYAEMDATASREDAS